MSGAAPWDPPLLTKGQWDVDIALRYVRAGLREPLPEVHGVDKLARLYASALADLGLVTEENRKLIGEVLLLMSSQLAASFFGRPDPVGMSLCNILSLAGLRVYEEGELRQCGQTWADPEHHSCCEVLDHGAEQHLCLCGATS
jgi:hypothetical protein